MAVVEFGCTGEPRRWGLILFGTGPSSPLDGFAVTCCYFFHNNAIPPSFSRRFQAVNFSLITK